MTSDKTTQISEALLTKYQMKVPRNVALSVLMGQTKVPILLSRASFRSDVDARTQQRTKFQRERRQFLHTMLGLVGCSVIGLLLAKTLMTPTAPPPAASNPYSSPQSPINYISNAATGGAQLLANASNIPPNQFLTFNDPAAGPAILIHLDTGQFAAYSTICTHAGCQVQYDPSLKDLVCPCHGAVYDPANNAQVVQGPAPYPLQSIPLQYDKSTGNIYATT
jgi:thiosulfate dehydrogenase [quinone] large subunit